MQRYSAKTKKMADSFVRVAKEGVALRKRSTFAVAMEDVQRLMMHHVMKVPRREVKER
jgi:hypothetical protein